jgi:N-acetyl sugar amidotransferase
MPLEAALRADAIGIDEVWSREAEFARQGDALSLTPQYPHPDRPYQLCVTCVMDTTDPEIDFDKDGRCNHCRTAETLRGRTWFPDDEGRRRLEALVARIKNDGRGKRYDCIMGLSGGVDSSYLIYKMVTEHGLRPLAVHVDSGWNSEIAVHNIEQLVRRLNIDLCTEVIDWPTERDLQSAFLRSGVPNQDIPQDHANVRFVFQNAARHGVGYLLSGSNIATESILPEIWGADSIDSVNIRDIHSRHGRGTLAKFPMMGFFDYYFIMPFVRRVRLARPLNLMPYDRDEAIETISREIGWRSYGDKHHESRWTKYFQTYYLPMKLGYDKRRAHYSSMIASGAMTRTAALEKLKAPPFDRAALLLDEEFLMRKLNMRENEFRDAINTPYTPHDAYANSKRLEAAKEVLKRTLGIRGTL